MNALLASEIAERLGENVSDLAIDTLYDNTISADSEFNVPLPREHTDYKIFCAISYKLSVSDNITTKHGVCTGYFSPDQFDENGFTLNIKPLSFLSTGETYHLELYGIRGNQT